MAVALLCSTALISSARADPQDSDLEQGFPAKARVTGGTYGTGPGMSTVVAISRRTHGRSTRAQSGAATIAV